MNIDEIYLTIKNSSLDNIDYYIMYNSLINERLSRGIEKDALSYYTEKHHILPRCMGGKDEGSNYVLLTAKEHIIAHILLALSYPDSVELSRAAMFVTSSSFALDRELPEIEKVKLFSITRELYSAKRRKAVVCYDLKTLEIYKIFSSITETETYGFNKTQVSDCSRSKKIIDSKGFSYILKSVKGYGFKLLAWFEDNHPELVEEYFYKLNNNKLKDIIIDKNIAETNRNLAGINNTKQVVCINPESGTIIGIFSSINKAKKMGASETEIRRCLSGTRKTHRNLIWKLVNDVDEELIKTFLESNNIDQFVNLSFNNPNYTPIKKIVMCELQEPHSPIKIFSSLRDAERHGYHRANISKVLSGKYKQANKYFWMEYDKAKILFKNEIELLEQGENLICDKNK
jgi:hypothetical protein